MTRTQGIALVLATVFASYLGHALTSIPHDDTDPASGRSGLRLFTDAKTGCQYVGAGLGITPRLRADGTQVCIPPTESQA